MADYFTHLQCIEQKETRKWRAREAVLFWEDATGSLVIFAGVKTPARGGFPTSMTSLKKLAVQHHLVAFLAK